MYCKFCGSKLKEKSKFCISCGMQQGLNSDNEKNIEVKASKERIGYSSKISDPSFKKYIRNSKQWAAIFSSIMALAAIIGFFIAGEMRVDNLSNPEALYIGFVIGGMFIAIAFFQIIGKKGTHTWDGIVDDKIINEKTKRSREDNNSYVDYLEYKVIIKAENGKIYSMTADNDDTKYNYYKIGDRVRHHGGINTYEKYDKSEDDIIFCNACASLCDIQDDYCFRCKCPLLK